MPESEQEPMLSITVREHIRLLREISRLEDHNKYLQDTINHRAKKLEMYRQQLIELQTRNVALQAQIDTYEGTV